MNRLSKMFVFASLLFGIFSLGAMKSSAKTVGGCKTTTAGQVCPPTAGKESNAHVPCGCYSDAECVKTLPASTITMCFGKAMTRDEAAKEAEKYK
jgi:hypothetical protein